MTGQLKQLRDKIDIIDSELLKLMSARAGLAREIGEIKNGMAYRPEREAQVLARLCELNPGPLATSMLCGYSLKSCHCADPWKNL